MHRGVMVSPRKSNGSFPNPQQTRGFLHPIFLTHSWAMGLRDQPRIITYTEGLKPVKGHIMAHPLGTRLM